MRVNVLVHPWIICLVLQNCKKQSSVKPKKKIEKVSSIKNPHYCHFSFSWKITWKRYFFNTLKNSMKTFLTSKQLWVLLYLHLIWSNKQSNFRPSCNYLLKYLGFCYIWRADPLLWLRLPHQDLILHLRLIVLLAVLWIHILLLSPEI